MADWEITNLVAVSIDEPSHSEVRYQRKNAGPGKVIIDLHDGLNGVIKDFAREEFLATPNLVSVSFPDLAEIPRGYIVVATLFDMKSNVRASAQAPVMPGILVWRDRK